MLLLYRTWGWFRAPNTTSHNFHSRGPTIFFWHLQVSACIQYTYIYWGTHTYTYNKVNKYFKKEFRICTLILRTSSSKGSHSKKALKLKVSLEFWQTQAPLSLIFWEQCNIILSTTMTTFMMSWILLCDKHLIYILCHVFLPAKPISGK